MIIKFTFRWALATVFLSVLMIIPFIKSSLPVRMFETIIFPSSKPREKLVCAMNLNDFTVVFPNWMQSNKQKSETGRFVTGINHQGIDKQMTTERKEILCWHQTVWTNVYSKSSTTAHEKTCWKLKVKCSFPFRF